MLSSLKLVVFCPETSCERHFRMQGRGSDMKLDVKSLLRGHGQEGFSLVELMVVVAIIGILATIAVPRFKVFQAKARQAEAKTNLAHIYTLEQAYFGDNDQYATLAEIGGPAGCKETDNDLGFYIDNCKKTRYKYWVTVAGTTDFTGNAQSGTNKQNKVMPGCKNADHWTINANKVLKATKDVTRDCK